MNRAWAEACGRVPHDRVLAARGDRPHAAPRADRHAARRGDPLARRRSDRRARAGHPSARRQAAHRQPELRQAELRVPADRGPERVLRTRRCFQQRSSEAAAAGGCASGEGGFPRAGSALRRFGLLSRLPWLPFHRLRPVSARRVESADAAVDGAAEAAGCPQSRSRHPLPSHRQSQGRLRLCRSRRALRRSPRPIRAAAPAERGGVGAANC